MKTLFTHEEWELLQSIYALPAMNTELVSGATGHIEDHKRIAEYISYFPSRGMYSYTKTADNEWTIFNADGSKETTVDQYAEGYIEGSVQEGFVCVLGITTPKGVSASELPIESSVTVHAVGARLLKEAIENAMQLIPYVQLIMSQMADLEGRLNALENPTSPE